MDASTVFYFQPAKSWVTVVREGAPVIEDVSAGDCIQLPDGSVYLVTADVGEGKFVRTSHFSSTVHQVRFFNTVERKFVDL